MVFFYPTNRTTKFTHLILMFHDKYCIINKKKLYFIPLKSLPLPQFLFNFNVTLHHQAKKWTW